MNPFVQIESEESWFFTSEKGEENFVFNVKLNSTD